MLRILALLLLSAMVSLHDVAVRPLAAAGCSVEAEKTPASIELCRIFEQALRTAVAKQDDPIEVSPTVNLNVDRNRRLNVTFPKSRLILHQWGDILRAAALVSQLKNESAVEEVTLDLSETYREKCDERIFVETLRFEVPITIRVAGPEAVAQHRSCPPTDRALLAVVGSSFNHGLQFALVGPGSLDIALTGARVLGSVVISGRESTRGVGYLPTGGRVIINNSQIDGDLYMSRVELEGLSLYFNRMASINIGQAIFTKDIEVHDNSLGPFRMTQVILPSVVNFQSNQFADSLYPRSVVARPTGPPSVFSHNTVRGNLLVETVAPLGATGALKLMPRQPDGTMDTLHYRPEVGDHQDEEGGADPRVEYYFMGNSIQGSAHFLKVALGERSCVASTGARTLPFTLPSGGLTHVDFLYSEVKGRLVLGSAIYRPVDHAGTEMCQLVATPLATGDAFEVDLTGSDVGIVAWNFADNDRSKRWTGERFRFRHFEGQLLRGEHLVSTDRESLGLHEMRFRNWIESYAGVAPDPHRAAEEYARGRGRIFASREYHADMLEENLAVEAELLVASPPSSWVRRVLSSYDVGWLAYVAAQVGSVYEIGMSSLTKYLNGPIAELRHFSRAFALWLADVWGAPANHGATPERAFFLLLALPYLGGVVLYRLHGHRWGVGQAWACTPKFTPEFGFKLSRMPGFFANERDDRRTVNLWMYSFDCIVPILEFGLRRKVHPYRTSAWGRIVTGFPMIQQVCGLWGGSLALGMLVS